ncbi:MAG: sulfite exporter TauE/SafE family protein [Cyanobacteria bacterium SZAS TMP-1]|nr:sulfite exporter TauE/SafE family protein [Cyanobacteria bacterium SZAS TMP-1]
MPPLHYVIFLLIGLTAGVLAGMFGLGGGLIMIPAMTAIGLSFKSAAGTSLAAQLLPFAILGVIEYYRNGDVNVPGALLLVVGLFFGAFLGAKLTVGLPEDIVKKAFGVFCLLAAAKYLLTK